MLVVVVIELLWFCMARAEIIPAYAGIVLVALTCMVAVWLLPYFTSAVAETQSGAKNT